LLAFTFPGQGSQRPGMGSAWVDHPSFELVALASEVTGRDIAHLLLEADQETLTKTDNAQIATFVQSLIVLDAAERLGIEPSAAAGHSLGEYTALVAAGALDFEEGLRLVQERGAAMREAAESAPGTMIAILGLDDESVETACRRVDGEAWVANFNAPGQVIVAGTTEALGELSAIAKELGAKRVMSMPVGGAFHTPLMSSARDRLRKALANTSFHALDPFVVANVDARPHEDPEEWPQLLSAQLCSPVRWRQSLETLLSEGMQTFVELGPGGVLTGLLRRAAPTTDTIGVSVSTPDDLARLVQILAGGTAAAAPTGERFEMTERLVVSPAVGLFEPAAALRGYLPGNEGRPGDPVTIEVGGLVGLVGGTEIRSAFAGTLQGVLVLKGERVSRGQPVAWLRAPTEGARAVHDDSHIKDERVVVLDDATLKDERTA
jgi:[acyl-carrier-protein] S-malonyltransferase